MLNKANIQAMSVNVTLQPIKYEKANDDLMNPKSVHGKRFLFTLFFINIENRNGIKICDMMTTQKMPMIDIKAIDFNAGCCAKIKTPKPAMVVMADKIIDDLKEERFFFPVLYSCNKPSIINKL